MNSNNNIDSKRIKRETDPHAKMLTMEPTTINNSGWLPPSRFLDQKEHLLPRRESFSPKFCAVLATPM